MPARARLRLGQSQKDGVSVAVEIFTHHHVYAIRFFNSYDNLAFFVLSAAENQPAILRSFIVLEQHSRLWPWLIELRMLFALHNYRRQPILVRMLNHIDPVYLNRIVCGTR